ncbi:MAG: hypothetical protein FJZ11_07160 [Candidatus Omnitrophica bacterium]|nr:hypothetical protein [Candidatus Omnitrophota bacterium]
MKRYGKYQNGMIQTACGLRFEYLFQVPLSQRKQSKNILVALEGIFGAYKVVNYVLRELAGDKQYRVRLRTHPLLPLKDFQNKLDYNFQEVPNFELSHGSSLTQDIEWSDVVIYWGSTVALEALSMGKPVIHFDTGSVLSYDPLFECNNLKWSVRENEPLKPVIEKITSLDEDDFIRRRNAAKEYLKQYFYPVTEENLNKFIINE